MGAFPATEQLATSGQRAPLRALADAFTHRGTATLVAGTVTVPATGLTANSVILLGRNTPGGTLGNLSAPDASRVVGTSFDIDSDDVADVSTVDYLVVG